MSLQLEDSPESLLSCSLPVSMLENFRPYHFRIHNDAEDSPFVHIQNENLECELQNGETSLFFTVVKYQFKDYAMGDICIELKVKDLIMEPLPYLLSEFWIIISNDETESKVNHCMC